MKQVEIYTDGACSGNPGPGGWCAILLYGKKEKVLSGGERATTNNRMELKGAIEGLSALKEPCAVKLYTDSAYVCNAFLQDWISGWVLNGWRSANKKPVLNQDLWEELLNLTRKHTVRFVKVKGHADNEYNNKCDKIAVKESEKFKSDLTKLT
ncbi:MAG: ribonuclease HI [Christensenellaceae bacterium]|jgi:ribonuclease HI|nr:ribonuclease HI [Christensenellaceae bacterium]